MARVPRRCHVRRTRRHQVHGDSIRIPLKKSRPDSRLAAKTQGCRTAHPVHVLPPIPLVPNYQAACSHTDWPRWASLSGMMLGILLALTYLYSTSSQPFFTLLSIIRSAIADASVSVGAARTSRESGALRVEL